MNIYGQEGQVSQFGKPYRSLVYRARTEAGAIAGLQRAIAERCGDAAVVLRGGTFASWKDGERWKARARYHAHEETA